jgi:hypothetical protein|tara:strand:- start:186 stop:503 length:318 start_codon:yes stop_codon:yes gene_type:complete
MKQLGNNSNNPIHFLEPIMKIHITLLGLVLCLPLMAADKKPLTKEESAKIIEAAIRKELKKPTGELTKTDYEKVTELVLYRNQLTDVKGLEKLTQLKQLFSTTKT